MVSRKPYPDELRERAVQMVFELRAETGNARGSIARVGQRLGDVDRPGFLGLPAVVRNDVAHYGHSVDANK